MAAIPIHTLASITLLNPNMTIVVTAQKGPHSFQTTGHVTKNQGCHPLVHLQRVIIYIYIFFMFALESDSSSGWPFSSFQYTTLEH